MDAEDSLELRVDASGERFDELEVVPMHSSSIRSSSSSQAHDAPDAVESERGEREFLRDEDLPSRDTPPVFLHDPDGERRNLNEAISEQNTALTVLVDHLTYEVDIQEVEQGTRTVAQAIRENIGLSKVVTADRGLVEDLCFYVVPKMLLLVLGTPGSGRTTIANVLAGKIAPGRITQGRIRFSGQPMDRKNHHNLVAHVKQDDIHYAELTVDETLEFAGRMRVSGANLRTPVGVQLPNRAALVHRRKEVVLEVLGMAHRRDTIVGNALLRGVSGGEKKRVTIGVEMMNRSQLIVMDEPTTGLDSSTSLRIFEVMRLVSSRFAPVIAILQQPSRELFFTFTHLMLLTKGRIVYFGDLRKALRYFEQLGYPCPRDLNPAEYFSSLMDHPWNFEPVPGATPVKTAEAWIELWTEHFKNNPLFEEERETLSRLRSVSNLKSQRLLASAAPSKGPLRRRLASTKHTEKNDDEMDIELQSVAVEHDQVPEDTDVGKEFLGPEVEDGYATGFSQQLKWCVWRSFMRIKNNPKPILFLLVLKVFWSVVFGTVFLRLGHDQVDLGLRQGLVYNMVSSMGLTTNRNIAESFVDRPVFTVQRRERYYATLPFFLSNLITYLPIIMADVVLFITPAYWMANLNTDFDRFVYLILMGVVLTISCDGIMRSFANLFSRVSVAQSFGPTGMDFLMVYAGFFVLPTNIPPWVIWLYYISPFAYAYGGSSINELGGVPFNCTASELVPPTSDPLFNAPFEDGGYEGQQTCPITNGSQRLDLQGLPTEQAAKWVILAILFGIAMACQFCSFVLLRFTHHYPPVRRAEVLREPKGVDSSIVEAEHQPHVDVTLAFKNLDYGVKIPKQKELLMLLTNVSAYVKPGMMVALMGPSGAGKSTLLDVVADRKTGKYDPSTIFINGTPRPPTLNRFTGYCEQQDLHVECASVKEAIEFAALTRLSDVPRRQKLLYAHDVMQSLHLDNVHDTMVSDLSVEQKKRLTVAVELAANPSILFMDEPTSGIDGNAALNVMKIARKEAENGRCVLCTIHQPSTTIFSMFTHLLLLRTGGRVVYFGPTGAPMLKYFAEKLDRRPASVWQNPADFALEVCGPREDGQDPASIWDENGAAVVEQEIEQQLSAEEPPPNFEGRYASSLAFQFGQLFVREILKSWRDPQAFGLACLKNLVVGVLVGVTFWQMPNNQAGAIERTSLLFFGLTIALYNSFVSVPNILDDRAAFYRERAAFTYSSISYAAALALAPLPFAIVSLIFYQIPVYFLAGLKLEPGAFFVYLLISILVTMSMMAFVQAVAVYAPNLGIANVLCACVLIVMIVCAGFFVPVREIPPWWIWGYYFNVMRYPLQVYVINEYVGEVFNCPNNEGAVPVLVNATTVPPQVQFYCPITSGDQVLAAFDIESEWLWPFIAVTFGWWLVSSFLMWIGLKFVNHLSR